MLQRGIPLDLFEEVGDLYLHLILQLHRPHCMISKVHLCIVLLALSIHRLNNSVHVPENEGCRDSSCDNDASRYNCLGGIPRTNLIAHHSEHSIVEHCDVAERN